MKHSNKIAAQLIVSYCKAKSIASVVISPGSRNAPLIIEFNTLNSIKKYSIVDERSAAFFALGMAQETNKPVALVCSSGSALLNYYPAIAEAYYSRIPLIIISADRPQRLIDVGDGQTIRQENVFRNHIGFSANLDENNHKKNKILLQQAFTKQDISNLPIHINIPFDEPLYEHLDKEANTDMIGIFKKEEEAFFLEKTLEVDALEKFADIWNKSKRKMLLLGVCQPDEMLRIQLLHLIEDPSVIVLTENTSNLINSKFINKIDQAIFPFDDKKFQDYCPDILLTFGGMVVSKKIKQLLRKNPPKHHWHVDLNRAYDTYYCLSNHFEVNPVMFFSQFFFLTETVSSDYQQKWLKLKFARAVKHQSYLKKLDFSDLKVFELLNRFIPKNCNLQFSNSATIRYAQLFSWSENIKIACNRGTSGIDGSISTAVGVSVTSKKQTLLITGDLSFFYDSNALWNTYIPSNFRIILINNGGGGIFRFISGPTTTDTLDYFETPHNLSAKHLCLMHGVSYKSVTNITDLEHELAIFFDKGDTVQLLEIFTPKEYNAKALKAYFMNL